MSNDSRTLGRRRLLLLIGGAAAAPAGAALGCGGRVKGAPSSSSGASDAASSGDAAIAVDAGGVQDVVGDTLEDVATIDDGGSPLDSPGDRAGDGDSGQSPGLDAGCPSGNVVTVEFAAYPSLVNVGGSAMLMVQCYSDPICGENGIVVVHTMDGRYLAFSSGCTHACCTLSFTGSTLLCPCDGGTFDLTGQAIAGPPKMPLPVLRTTWDANAVYVTI